MDLALENLDVRRHAQDLRDTWQARVLKHASGKLGAVVLSMLAHNFDDAMPILLRVVFPGFTTITAPFFCSAGKVAKTGHVCADIVTKDGEIIRMFAIFRSVTQMEWDFRRIADRLALTDTERKEMFVALRRWLVCDYRIDPTMDPRDPDAARLVVH